MEVVELEESVVDMDVVDDIDLMGCGHYFYSDYSSSILYSDCTVLIQNLLGNQTVHTRGPGYMIVPVVFGIITVVGLIGNLCVILIIARNKAMRSVTNFFIMNNAVSDMMFLLVCAPITASTFALPTWIYGDFMCKAVVYMQYVSTIPLSHIHSGIPHAIIISNISSSSRSSTEEEEVAAVRKNK